MEVNNVADSIKGLEFEETGNVINYIENNDNINLEGYNLTITESDNSAIDNNGDVTPNPETDKSDVEGEVNFELESEEDQDVNSSVKLNLKVFSGGHIDNNTKLLVEQI